VKAQGRGPAADQEGRQKLISYLDGIAESQLAARKQAIAQIHTAAETDRRKALVHEKLLQLIGGLPERHGSSAVKTYGTMPADGFRVDKIAYESLLGFWVTADLYIPGNGVGPFPAVILAPGHGAAGKPEHHSWGANLALSGIAALAYDPVGEGERLQYFDPDLKGSKIGGPTAEHSEANTGPLLIGDDLARYWLNDAMRGVVYLVARKDIAADRIGAFGCSGGQNGHRGSGCDGRSYQGGCHCLLHHLFPRAASFANGEPGGGAEHSAFHRARPGLRGLGGATLRC
jgi:hypothetical protein